MGPYGAHHDSGNMLIYPFNDTQYLSWAHMELSMTPKKPTSRIFSSSHLSIRCSDCHGPIWSSPWL